MKKVLISLMAVPFVAMLAHDRQVAAYSESQAILA
jgi:hypothetical protein